MLETQPYPMMLPARVICPALCLLAALVRGADSQPLVLDQYNTIPTLDGGALLGPGSRHAQTFRVGLAGTLAAVDFTVFWPGGDLPNGPLRVDLYDTTATGLPGLNVLATTFVNANQLSAQYDSYARISFANGPVPVAPGQLLAIVLSTTATVGKYYVSATSEYGEDGYVYGAGYVDGGRGWQKPFEGFSEWDYGFRTYVLVPEPSVIKLLALPLFAPLLLPLFRRGKNLPAFGPKGGHALEDVGA